MQSHCEICKEIIPDSSEATTYFTCCHKFHRNCTIEYSLKYSNAHERLLCAICDLRKIVRPQAQSVAVTLDGENASDNNVNTANSNIIVTDEVEIELLQQELRNSTLALCNNPSKFYPD